MSLEDKLRQVQQQAASGNIKPSAHAEVAMLKRGVSIDDIAGAVANGQILEDYPASNEWACCLLYGVTDGGRRLHIVCTTARAELSIITVYEPMPPKWITPTQRGTKQ
jgi:Domain of unknown function (DUF4258)